MKEYAREDYVQEYSTKERLYRSDISSAKEEGLKLGKAEGVKLGRTEGIDYANLKIAQKLKDRNMSLSEIKEITGLPLNKIASL